MIYISTTISFQQHMPKNHQKSNINDVQQAITLKCLNVIHIFTTSAQQKTMSTPSNINALNLITIT
jgi:hypothetical protein